MSRKKKLTGRRFAMLPLTVMDHKTVQTLNHAEFRVLMLLAREFNGHNNGGVGVTAEQAREHGIKSKNTFYESLRELESRGLIRKTCHASRVPPRPAMYALTWLPLNDTKYSEAERVPSNKYQQWRNGAMRDTA